MLAQLESQEAQRLMKLEEKEQCNLSWLTQGGEALCGLISKSN